MAGKVLIGMVVLGTLAGAAWIWRDTPAVRDATRQLQAGGVGRWVGEQAKSITPDQSGQRKSAATPEATAGAGLHKCAGEAGVTYTNGACPPGTRRLQVDGAVTVLPAVRPAPAPPPAQADAPASGPVRGPLAELAGPPLKGSLKDKHMDGMR